MALAMMGNEMAGGENFFLHLREKIKRKKSSVSIIGLGYVGLPLSKEIARAGFPVSGIDRDKKGVLERVKMDEENLKFFRKGKIKLTDDFDELRKSDIIIICVPTPLDPFKNPDMSYIKDASSEILKRAKKGQLIILESTVYPGTTREFIVHPLNDAGFRAGENIFIAYCPERVDPGNKTYNIKNTPRVIGGYSNNCLALAREFYEKFVQEKIHVLSSLETAEMTKLFENIFRNVNIALVNELAILCREMGIDVWEVIDGAKTKPFGFMAFYPGPGVGGHCIPVDPFYLSYKAKFYGLETKFIQLAGEINDSMPQYVVKRTIEILNSISKPVKNSRILLAGMTYKPDVPDIRESPSLKVFSALHEMGARIFYIDPLVPFLRINGKLFRSIKEPLKFRKKFDLTIILTPHSGINYSSIIESSLLIFDTRGFLRGKERGNKKITFL